MGPPGGVASKPTLESHYSELTRMIAEVGRDVKPAYTNSKVSADRLRKSEAAGVHILHSGLFSLGANFHYFVVSLQVTEISTHEFFHTCDRH